MKMAGETMVVERSGSFEETSFQINPESQVHIIKIIRDKLYSNKPLAVIREYCTNAYDAHVEVGRGDQPIVVTLPSEFDQHFRVRDYGTGLTEDEIRQIYVQYGVSTKRHSNDFIGQLGIGCKSAFAYCDMFMIVSFKDSVKSTYSAYIDESELGKVALMSQEPTDESNGIEIMVPVKRQDTTTFIEQARKCFQFFPVKPIILGMSEFEYPPLKEIISGKDIDANCWRVYEEGSATAIMGNIGYPLNSSNMGQLEEWERQLLRCAVHIRFEIGDVEIAASREALEYKDRTIQVIRRKLSLIRDTVNGTIQGHINVCNNLLEAKQAYVSFYVATGAFNNFITQIKPISTKWRGIILDPTIISVGTSWGSDETWDTKIIQCGEHRTGRRRHSGPMAFSQRLEQQANAGPDVMVVEVDSPDKWFLRVHQLWLDLYKQTSKKYRIFAIKFADDPIERVKLYAKYDLSHIPMIKVSTITLTVKARVAKGAISTTVHENNTKHQAKVFVLNKNRISSNTWDRGVVRSSYWDEVKADIKNGQGIYIELDGFFMKMFGTEPRHMSFLGASDDGSNYGDGSRAGIFTHLDTLDIDISQIPIYGIKTAMVPKLGKYWVRFEDWVVKLMVDKLQAIDIICQRQVDWDYTREFGLWREEIRKLAAESSGVRQLDNIFVNHLSEADRMGGYVSTNLCHEYRRVIGWLKCHTKALKDFEPSYDLRGSLERVETRYPVIRATGVLREEHGSLDLEMYTRGGDPKSDTQVLIEYINQTDEYLELKGGKQE